MTDGTARGSAIIHAPAARVYGIIADYRVHHPRIVPPEYFRTVEVEAGGVLEPAEQARSSSVTIETTFRVRPGPLAAIERAATAAMLGRIYQKELARLEHYAASLSQT
jgi:hypothetical protein